jgi:hypothetical protein
MNIRPELNRIAVGMGWRRGNRQGGAKQAGYEYSLDHHERLPKGTRIPRGKFRHGRGGFVVLPSVILKLSEKGEVKRANPDFRESPVSWRKSRNASLWG